MTIEATHATPENFAPYGSIAGTPFGPPTSQAADYKFWSDIAHYRIEGETEIGICTVFEQPVPEITALERHLRTPEILIPIDASFVVPLLLDGKPLEEAKAFRVDPGEAIVVEKGIWHGACLPVDERRSSYFVIFRRNTPHDDVEKKSVPSFRVSVA